jgi:hypothetical protein
MVLTLKRWKSRSSPGIEAGGHIKTHSLVRDPSCKRRRPSFNKGPTPPFARPTHGRATGDAGWSSPVARQAHNLKVVGSNPTPATNDTKHPLSEGPGALLVWANSISVKLHAAWPDTPSTARGLQSDRLAAHERGLYNQVANPAGGSRLQPGAPALSSWICRAPDEDRVRHQLRAVIANDPLGLPRTKSIWQRDSQPNACGNPEAVQAGLQMLL